MRFARFMRDMFVRRRAPAMPDEIEQLACLSAIETFRRWGKPLRSNFGYYVWAARCDIALGIARQVAPCTMGEKAASKRAGEYRAVPIDELVFAGGERPDDVVEDAEIAHARAELLELVTGRAATMGIADQRRIAGLLAGRPQGTSKKAWGTAARLGKELRRDPVALALRRAMASTRELAS